MYLLQNIAYLNMYEYMHLYVQMYFHSYKGELLSINLYVLGTFYSNKNYTVWLIFIMPDYDYLCLKEYQPWLRKGSYDIKELQMNGFLDFFPIARNWN